ncbi:leucine-rich repeat domain-containing protein, partial [Porphyromonadaceae bacterium OttesenSCG-928-L07]|nr:leucine-rich repeat domain-containing protein [Porphyromonadaceae bacterium OttesenSCG-928-L07]
GNMEIIAKGIAWHEQSDPAFSKGKIVNNEESDLFTCEISGLTPNTAYYAYAYATNEMGTTHGERVTFSTLDGKVALNTLEIVEIDPATIRIENEITETRGAQVVTRGICWGITENPTIKDNITEDGEGIGKFTSKITGMIRGTTYRIRAYATTETDSTFYGNEVIHNTPNTLIEVEAGALESTLKTLHLENTMRLKLTGTLDQRDFAYMNNMLLQGNLTEIDLAKIDIVAYDKYPANEIPTYAFAFRESFNTIDNEKLTKFIFPQSITSIGNCAFERCIVLNGKLEIPSGVTNIGSRAFRLCSGLNGELILPPHIQTIGMFAFFACSEFTGSLKIPGSLKTISGNTFTLCTGLNGILTIENGVESIEDGAFCDCSGFTGSLNIPNSVKKISSRAFEKCTGLNGTLSLSDNLEALDLYAFSGCFRFTGTLKIPKRIKKIPNWAFKNCSGFDELIISDSVEHIGKEAFYYCTGLKNTLNISKNVKTIEEGAFANCTSLTNIKVAWEAPITFNLNMFPYPWDGEINVPESAIELYQSAEYWKLYTIRGY